MVQLTLQRPFDGRASEAIAHAQALLSEGSRIRAYSEVPAWRHRAGQQTTVLAHLVAEGTTASERKTQEANQIAAERNRRFFLVRWFLSRRPENDKRHEARVFLVQVEEMQHIASKLLEATDYTPINQKEQKALVKELRHERKELRIKKKDVNASKRTIHRAAKEASAQAGQVGWLFKSYDPTTAATERREIRRNRYTALAPYEDQARAIDWQLREVDRRLAFVERIGVTDEEDE